LLLATVPLVREFALLFHSVDVFWLAVVGLVTVAVVSRGGLIANLVAGGLGLLLATHGFNPVTGTARFTWGIGYLRDGIQLIPLLIGLFAVAEMLRLTSDRTAIVDAARDDGDGEIGDAADDREGRRAGVSAVAENRRLFGRSAAIGWLVGVVPGAGGTVANFVAYLSARATDASTGSFGAGDVRGVIASEAANDAKDGGIDGPDGSGSGSPDPLRRRCCSARSSSTASFPGRSCFRRTYSSCSSSSSGSSGRTPSPR